MGVKILISICLFAYLTASAVQGFSCPMMMGSYGGARISMSGTKLVGHWTPKIRQNFHGKFTGNCRGTMRFPDDRTYTFEYDGQACIIYWDGRKSGNRWYRTHCHGYHRQVACEHSKKNVNLRCSAGSVLVIHFANYGRTSKAVCRGSNSHINNCRAKSSLSKVRSRCSGKRRCSVAPSNRVFGDPCHGVVKYLEVHYSCIKKGVNRKIVCEHGGTNAHLRCPRGSHLRIRYANYGRTHASVCVGAHSKVTNCRAKSSLSVVRRMCGRKRQCSVSPTNAVFGDPCRHVNKYLEIRYECRKNKIHGRWGKWRRIGKCSKRCGRGKQKWIRSCNNPKPRYGGRPCKGKNTIYISCNKSPCRCPQMMGSYGGAAIFMHRGKLRGVFLTVNRKPFHGVFTDICKGRMTFPDDKTYTFQYDGRGCVIYWNGRKSGNRWRRLHCCASVKG